MTRWVIALVLGLVVIGAVYILRERATREQAEIGAAPDTAAVGEAGAPQSGTGSQEPVARVPGEAGALAPSIAVEPATSGDEEAAPALPPTGSVTVDNAWARASTPQGVTAVYMVLILVADEPDALTGARSSAAQSVEIHETRIEGNIMTMHRMESLDIDPDTPVAFEPRGLHFMVIGLKRPLKEGDSLPLELQFAHAGKLTLEVPVGEPTGTDALGHSME
jgi:hypothetical protein